MEQGVGDDVQFVLIDLEDVRFLRPENRRRCTQNLARFAREAVPYISVYTLMRFLRIYMRKMSWNGSVSGLAREIMRSRHFS